MQRPRQSLFGLPHAAYTCSCHGWAWPAAEQQLLLPPPNQVEWETMWRERLADYARPQEGKSALGWSTKITVEVGPAAAAAACTQQHSAAGLPGPDQQL